MTNAGTTAMPNEPSTGEARVRAKARRRWRILGGLALAGLIPGFLLGYTQGDGMVGADAVWPAWIVILLAVSYLLAVGVGGWALMRQMDEHELAGKHKAASFAGGILVLIYPVWFLLWMGALAPEPIHWVLFLAFYLSLCGADLYYRYRGTFR